MIGGWVAGVDVSSHQRPDRCDWGKARDAGVDFAFVRISIGADVVDEAAFQHIKRIRAAEIPVGVYHAARPDYRFDHDGLTDGVKAGRIEAEHALRCYEAVGLGCGEPLAIDYEKRSKNATREQRADYLRSMLGIIAAETDATKLLYTGDNIWASQMPESFAGELREAECLTAAQFFPEIDNDPRIRGELIRETLNDPAAAIAAMVANNRELLGLEEGGQP